MKKSIIIMLILALMFSVVACNKTNDDSTANDSNGEVANGEDDKDKSDVEEEELEPVEINLLGFGGNQGMLDVENDPVSKRLKELFNVTINYDLTTWSQYSDKLTMVIASGEFPDWYFYMDYDVYNQLYEDGLIENISKYMDNMELPSLEKHMTSLEGVNYFKEEDGFYCIPNYSGYNQNAMYIRRDWMEKLELEDPKDMAGLKTVLEKIVEADPDGKGTTGMTMFNVGFWADTMLSINYTGYYGWKEKNGEWDYYKLEDSYRDYLKYMQDLYESGLIDPDSVTQKKPAAMEKMSTGRAAITFLNANGNNFSSIEKPLLEYKSDAKLGLVIPRPAGPAGSLARSGLPILKATLINKDIEDVKKERILMVADWFLSEEGEELSLWGIKDEMYKVEDGKKIPLMDKTVEIWANDQHPIHGMLRCGDSVLKSTNEIVLAGATWCAENAVVDEVVNFAPERYRELSVLIKEVQDRYLLESIFDGIDIDATWDEYVKEMRETGVDEMADILKNDYEKK